MGAAKIIVSVDAATIARLAQVVKKGTHSSSGSLIEQAIDEKLNRLGKSRIARECAKLYPGEERALTDEGLIADVRDWREY